MEGWREVVWRWRSGEKHCGGEWRTVGVKVSGGEGSRGEGGEVKGSNSGGGGLEGSKG